MYCPDCNHELSKDNLKGGYHCQGCGENISESDALEEHPTRYFEIGTWWDR